MHFRTIVTLSLASLALAAESAESAIMDGPAVKAFLGNMQTQVAALDKTISGLTEANIAVQGPILLQNLNSLNDVMVSGATKIKATKALGIFEMNGLASSVSPLVTSSMSLFNNIISKRSVVVAGNQVEALAEGFKKQQAGANALGEALGTQLPSSLASQIPKGAVPPGLATVNHNKLTDTMFEIGIALFKGQDAKIDVAGSTIWPLAGKGGKRAVEFSA